jgi:hypothetical protein
VVRRHAPDLMVSAIRMPACRPHSQRALAANQSAHKRSTGQSVTRLGRSVRAPDHALGELPLTQMVDGVLFCDASPRRDDEMLTRLSPSERWSEALAGIDGALVVGGHTHQQDDRVVEAVRFINAGSVGLPYEGGGDARWLWIEDGVPELRPHRLRPPRRRHADAGHRLSRRRLHRRVADRARRGDSRDPVLEGTRPRLAGPWAPWPTRRSEQDLPRPSVDRWVVPRALLPGHNGPDRPPKTSGGRS